MGSVIFTNLPALLVVVPLLLAPISALFTFAGLGWAIAIVGQELYIQSAQPMNEQTVF